ncbi:MAG TPA: hypothetical protein VGR29_09795 [Thermomicrobiales bacterium]|nr:hypothetical protein [Thermomicrobiales bacterium]
MSQDDVQRTPPWMKKQASDEPGLDDRSDVTHVTASRAEDEAPAAGAPSTSDNDPSETVGTGTSIALGCVAGTILLIVFGLIFLALLALL